MKTAIIDSGIDVETLSLYENKVMSLAVRDGGVISVAPPQFITHGGHCARKFAEQTGVLPDISVSLDKDGASKANANDLALALEWCADNYVGLVSLSMGTTQLLSSGENIFPKNRQGIKEVLAAFCGGGQ